MTDKRRLRIEPSAGPLMDQVIEVPPDYAKWRVVAIEDDPMALWSIRDESEKIDGTEYEAHAQSVIAVIERVES